jgi:predicted double-glycine peptidase
VLLLTNASQESQFVEREIERAITYRKPIVPLPLEQLQLNSGFKFYIGNSQIIAVPEVRADAPEVRKALEGIRTFVRCPEKDTIPKTKTVLQRIPQECGAASLEIIFAYHGKPLSLERMCAETKTDENGCNAGELMRTAKRFGLDCHGFKKESVGQLLEMPMPCIIHWDFNHFLVLEGVLDGDVYLNDPVCGRRTIPTAELDKHFTGVVLTFQPTENW